MFTVVRPAIDTPAEFCALIIIRDKLLRTLVIVTFHQFR